MVQKILFLAVLFLSCASQIPPSGGPDDKTPPSVRYTVPPIGTVKYPVKSKITFVFSEWINGKTAQKCISIFPPPSKGVKIKASGRTIEIRPVQAFAESTTYHVEINTTLNDLHGNSIGTPYHFFFSTGATIDSGKFFGCVSSPDLKGLQPKVALFALGAALPPDTLLFGLPSYVVQTDSSGGFTFDHIRKGIYEIIAFADANGDNRFGPVKEAAFGPEEKSYKLDSVVGPLALYPVKCDTAADRIVSIKPLSNRVLAGSWTQIGDSSATSFFTEWRIEGINAKSTAPSCKEFVQVRNSVNFFIKLTDTTSLAPYRLIYKMPGSPVRLKNAPFADTVRFNGIHAPDTLRPAAAAFSPTGIADLRPAIKLVWSKPVTARTETWKMGDSLGDTVKLSIGNGLCDSTILQVQRPLKPDRQYRLNLPDTLFEDISGNRPRDTAFGTYGVKTISSDNLCYSLTGGASCLSKNDKRKWLFIPLGSSGQYVSGDSSGHFRFDSIPGSKGQLAAFIDYNDDNKPTTGNLFPRVRPEPYRLFPDTIEARMRWDIEGIEVPACEVCAKKKTPAPETAKPTGKTTIFQETK
jgi:hypothetical protein